MIYRHRLARSVKLPGRTEDIFAVLDDPARLGRHMTKPSAMMLGGTMAYDLGPEQGKGIGAQLNFKGNVLGLKLQADQRVVEYDPPRRKVWETAPSVRLLVIGPYLLGFEITQAGDHADFEVFIDYNLPDRWPGRVLGTLFGELYARWCVESILRDAKDAASTFIHRPREAAGPPR